MGSCVANNSALRWCRIRPMYGWVRVFIRDGIILFFAGIFTMTVADVPDASPPSPPFCEADWRQILSFFLVLSAAIAIVEALNSLAWSVSRRRKTDSMFPQTDRETTTGIDPLVPVGWAGAALGLGLLFLTYLLHGPSPCKPAILDSRYLAGAFTLGYGLVALTTAGLDIAWQYANRSKSS
jgi:hypothetical protein